MDISVVVASYNGEKYIFEQMTSILVQMSENDEIVISDDGSTDDTIEIINSIDDPRIKLVDGPHKGVIKNFENAINMSKNEIIIFSDQDDSWESQRVDKIRNAMVKNNADVVITDYRLIYSNGNNLSEHMKWHGGFTNNLRKNTYIGAMMSVRREWLFEVLPFPQHVPMHDWWIGLLTEIKHKKVIFINEPLVNYRRHGDNLTGTRKNSLIKKIIMRITILSQIIIKIIM